MDLTEVLQAILDKAGNKDYYVSARIETKDGDLKCVNVCMDMIQKPEKDSNGKELCCCYPGPEKGGIVDISETETTKTTETPKKKSKGELVREKLKVMED